MPGAVIAGALSSKRSTREGGMQPVDGVGALSQVLLQSAGNSRVEGRGRGQRRSVELRNGGSGSGKWGGMRWQARIWSAGLNEWGRDAMTTSRFESARFATMKSTMQATSGRRPA